MKAQELTIENESLMIGDWVYAVYNGIKYTAKVEKLDYDIAVICNGLPDDWQDGYDFDDIKPIPLTPEILEKNGFELYKQDFTSHKVYKFGSLDYIEADEGYMGVGGYVEYKHFNTIHRFIHYVFKLYYVHELQHALKLCGINKAIEL